jgi:hypothetical protein
MSEADLPQAIAKPQKLKALHRARARVQQLKRESRSAPGRVEEPLFVSEFLRNQVAGGLATTTGVSKRSERPASERPLILESAQEVGRSCRSFRVFVAS